LLCAGRGLQPNTIKPVPYEEGSGECTVRSRRFIACAGRRRLERSERLKLAIDPWFIVNSAPDEARLIRAAREINDNKPSHVLEKIKTAADEFKRPVIACLGLAFKADIDDLRESPALDITQQILAQGIGEVLVVEPNIKTLPKALAFKVATLVKLDEALEKANTIVALVDHKEFQKISANTLNSKVVIDTRGIW